MGLLLAAVGSRSRRSQPRPADTTAPTLVSFTIAVNGRTGTVVFSEAMDQNHQQGMTISAGGGGLAPASFQEWVNATTALLYIEDAPAFQGQTVTASCSGDEFYDLAGNLMAAFSGHAVTNDSEIKGGGITSITDIASPGEALVTTDANHDLIPGSPATIVGNDPAYNGFYGIVTIVSAGAFKIPVAYDHDTTGGLWYSEDM